MRECWAAGLKPEDRDLRIVQGIRGLLRAGIAMHHSGLLPILKEVIEILFQEGLIKVLAFPAAGRALQPAGLVRPLMHSSSRALMHLYRCNPWHA